MNHLDQQHDPQERIFQLHLHRLEVLKRWLELAIQPEPDDCPPEDLDLLLLLEQQEQDEFNGGGMVLVELQQRCRQARDQLNANLPIYNGKCEAALVAKPSAIPGAGLGLFYEPATTSVTKLTATDGEDGNGDGNDISSVETKACPDDCIPPGAMLCYYYGHLHDFHSAQRLQDRSYLMMVRDDILVDPGPLPHIRARYINDPLNEGFVNCKFVPECYRSAVVATRIISPGEELFASYGDGYWSQHGTLGRPKV